ncbi:MAG: class I SAM-dependent methyltransferase [Pseudomonadota bacterium]
MSDRETIDVYNDRAADYVALTQSAKAPEPTLVAFMARLWTGARVLDLGCGPGAASAHMAAAGLKPDPVDPAHAMVEIAKTTFHVPARLGDFYDLDGPYDAIWANFSLLHMPRADVPGYFHRLAEVMPKGLLHIGLKTGTGEERDTIGRKYSYFTVCEISEWLVEAGFEPETPITGEELGLAGTIDPYFTLSAVRSGN